MVKMMKSNHIIIRRRISLQVTVYFNFSYLCARLNYLSIMKRTIRAFLALIMISSAFFFISCTGKEATTGTLTIVAQAKDSIIPANTPIYFASSKANLDNKVYAASGWLDANSSKIFRDLTPNYYWYRIGGWDNYGASEVLAGVDETVILWVNTPTQPGK